MERNYKGEANWRRKKYDEIRASIEKGLGKELREKLKRENKTIAGWVKDCAEKYIRKED